MTLPAVKALRAAGSEPGDDVRVQAVSPGRLELERAEDLVAEFAGRAPGGRMSERGGSAAGCIACLDRRTRNWRVATPDEGSEAPVPAVLRGDVVRWCDHPEIVTFDERLAVRRSW